MKSRSQSKNTAIDSVIEFGLVRKDLFAVVDYFYMRDHVSTLDTEFLEYAAVSFTDRYSLD